MQTKYHLLGWIVAGLTLGFEQGAQAQSRVCVEDLPDCGSEMSASDWKRYNAMSSQEKAVYERKLWEEYNSREDQPQSGDFLANARSAAGDTGSGGKRDFLADARGGGSADFLATSRQPSQDGDFLSLAKNKREADRERERQRLEREKERRREVRLERDANLRAIDDVHAMRIRAERIEVRQAESPEPYRLVASFYCELYRRGSTRPYFVVSNVSRNPVSHRWYGADANTKRAMVLEVLQPKMEAFTLRYNGEHKCTERYGVVLEREYKEYWYRQFDQQWDLIGRWKSEGYGVYYAEAILGNQPLSHPHD